MLAIVAVCFATFTWNQQKTHIGTTASVLEVSTGVVFLARVDTGAAITLLHCVNLEIEDVSLILLENIGKIARFLLENRQGEKEWIRTKIIDSAQISTAEGSEERYHIRMKLCCRGLV